MKNLNKVLVSFIMMSFLIIPAVVSAADPITGSVNGKPVTGSVNGPTTIPIQIHNPFKCGSGDNDKCDLMDLITALLNNVVMPIAAVGVVLFIIYAGFSFVMAQGKPAEIAKAKSMLLWGLIGAGVLLGAAGISKVVQNTVDALIIPSSL